MIVRKNPLDSKDFFQFLPFPFHLILFSITFFSFSCSLFNINVSLYCSFQLFLSLSFLSLHPFSFFIISIVSTSLVCNYTVNTLSPSNSFLSLIHKNFSTDQEMKPRRQTIFKPGLKNSKTAINFLTIFT